MKTFIIDRIHIQRFMLVCGLLVLLGTVCAKTATTDRVEVKIGVAKAPKTARPAGLQDETLSQLSKPPIAPIRNVTDEYFGVKVTDPYRYMENLQDAEVQTYMKAQADYTNNILAKLPGRDAFYNRLKELDATSPANVGTVRQTANGKLFYQKTLPADKNAKLYLRESFNGKETLLVDPDTFEKQTGRPHAINYFFPSPDGKFVAYGMSASGSEDASIYILNTQTLQTIDTPISRALFQVVAWLPDGAGFFYNRLQKLEANMPPTARFQNNKIYLHKLGTSPETDLAILGNGVNPKVEIAATDNLIVSVGSVSPYVFVYVTNGIQNDFSLYAAPLELFNKGEIEWRRIVDASDGVVDFGVRGDDIYLVTHKNAPHFKIIKTSLNNPNPQAAETVVSASEAVVRGMGVQRDGLYVKLYDGGISRLMRVPFGVNAKPQIIKLPFEGSFFFLATNSRTEGVLMRVSSWNHQTGIYRYDPKTGKLTNTGLQPQAKYEIESRLVVEEVKVKSHDGTMIPLSILYKKGIKRDSSNPTLLTGYGAYGTSLNSFFIPTNLALLEKGLIVATAHVRGGGEYGDEWHKAGQKLTKPNTWKDFIACAEYLVQYKYTSPKKLAGEGGSAGGILIGRAITERPDLFGVAHIAVGTTNTVRLETDANGIRNIPEFGTVKELDGFRGLYEMDAFHHVKDGVKYPAVLLTHGANDPRVPPWQSLKMTARLQAASASQKPVLLRVDYEAGHGIGSNKDQSFKELADLLSFMMWQFGEPAY